jgi:hypothetical protein
MAKLMEGRKTTVRNLVLMLAGSLALGYLAITVIGNPIVAAQVGRRIPADTPVVLLGGSVKLEEHSFPVQNWQPGPLPTRYYYAPAGKSIATIVVKNNPGDGDGAGLTDRLSIPVRGASWEIDLVTDEAHGIAVKIQPDSTTPTNIDATAVSGALCFDSGNKRLNYSHSVCSADGISSPGTDTFTNVIVKINNVSIATLNCVNYDGTLPNKCKIVLRP